MANKEMTMKELNEFQKWCKEILPVVQAAADGEEIQFYGESLKEWIAKDLGSLNDGTKYRIKPRTITVNGFEVPEPVREAPEIGSRYWIATTTSHALSGDAVWNADIADLLWLSRGICHTTKEAAIAHAKAMLGIDPNSDSK